MEQIRAILKGRMAFAMLVTVGILLYACVSTSGDSHTYAVSNDAVAQVVHDAIAGDHDATPLNGSPVADCTGERNCTIAYTVQPPMGGLGDNERVADLQLVEPTRQIWKALFTDPQFQSGTIRVRGPVATVGGKAETGTYYHTYMRPRRCVTYRLEQRGWQRYLCFPRFSGDFQTGFAVVSLEGGSLSGSEQEVSGRAA